jgi:hypothetical protein
MNYNLPNSRAVPISPDVRALMEQYRLAAERRDHIKQNGLPESYAQTFREVVGTSTNGFFILFNDAADEPVSQADLPAPVKNKKPLFSFLLGETAHNDDDEIPADRPFNVKVLTQPQVIQRLWDRIAADNKSPEIAVLQEGLKRAEASRRSYNPASALVLKRVPG